MLVLSRKTHESIQIGDEVFIKVLSVKGGGVRIGIEAPEHISIIRSELLQDLVAGDCASIDRPASSGLCR